MTQFCIRCIESSSHKIHWYESLSTFSLSLPFYTRKMCAYHPLFAHKKSAAPTMRTNNTQYTDTPFAEQYSHRTLRTKGQLYRKARARMNRETTAQAPLSLRGWYCCVVNSISSRTHDFDNALSKDISNHVEILLDISLQQYHNTIKRKYVYIIFYRLSMMRLVRFYVFKLYWNLHTFDVSSKTISY